MKNEHGIPPDSASEPGDELRLLSALIDGELSDSERDALMGRLAQEPASVERMAHYRAQHAALKALFPLPADVPSLFIQRRTSWWSLGLTAGATLAAGLAVGAIVTYGALGIGTGQPAFVHSADLAYAVYTPEQNHPVEMSGADSAQLQHWLSKRLDRSLTIPSLSEYGYTLLGGRLLPGNSGPAALFMYQNKTGQRLTLYIAAYDKGNLNPHSSGTANLRTIYWANQGMGYAFSGQENESQLHEIALDVCNSLGGVASSWKDLT
ncbi:MAG: anti-sigma factor [Formivibrio sp.]|nr:anti-sigma factor [Formivibrio sp.]